MVRVSFVRPRVMPRVHPCVSRVCPVSFYRNSLLRLGIGNLFLFINLIINPRNLTFLNQNPAINVKYIGEGLGEGDHLFCFDFFVCDLYM